MEKWNDKRTTWQPKPKSSNWKRKAWRISKYFVFTDEVLNLWGLTQKSIDGFSHSYFPLLDFFSHVIYLWMLAWVDSIDAYCNLRATLSLKVAYWHTFDNVCPNQWPSNGSIVSRWPQNTTTFKAWAQIKPFILDKAHNLVRECKLVKDVFELHNHNSTTHIIGFKQANGDVFGLLIGGEEFINHCKNIVGPFGHP